MKAMIFDADGTLLDSMGLWRRIDQAFLNAHHYPYSTAISEQVEVMSLQQSAAYFQQLLARGARPSAFNRLPRSWMHCVLALTKLRFRQCPLSRPFWRLHTGKGTGCA